MAGRVVLELHVAEMRQLFNAMDPAPFRECDIDPNAYNYIVDWVARRLSEIFPYDWWSIRAEAKLLDRSREMTVQVLDTPSATGVAAT